MYSPNIEQKYLIKKQIYHVFPNLHRIEFINLFLAPTVIFVSASQFCVPNSPNFAPKTIYPQKLQPFQLIFRFEFVSDLVLNNTLEMVLKFSL